MKHVISVEIDTDRLCSVNDECLADWFYVAQCNPAPMDDIEAGRVADAIGAEIVRRWLKDTIGVRYGRSLGNAYWAELVKHCRCVDGRWVAKGGGDNEKAADGN